DAGELGWQSVDRYRLVFAVVPHFSPPFFAVPFHAHNTQHKNNKNKYIYKKQWNIGCLFIYGWNSGTFAVPTLWHRMAHVPFFDGETMFHCANLCRFHRFPLEEFHHVWNSARHASCSCSGRCSLLNQSNLTGLEFRFLSAAYAERVDDLVD
ncbi:hypothetical protein, partial [Bifidobacterium adolescentis]|uniref:hypothetical protein n=1 Tax=Bifidobacterium adolescentis TaxID=1680 RepID=UPI001C23A706